MSGFPCKLANCSSILWVKRERRGEERGGEGRREREREERGRERGRRIRKRTKKVDRQQHTCLHRQQEPPADL